MNASAILDEEDDEGEAGGGDGVVLEWGGRRSDVIPAIDLLGNPSQLLNWQRICCRGFCISIETETTWESHH